MCKTYSSVNPKLSKSEESMASARSIVFVFVDAKSQICDAVKKKLIILDKISKKGYLFDRILKIYLDRNH